MTVDPEARRVDTSIPNISWIVFHFVLLQKVQMLIFIRVVGMMRCLFPRQPALTILCAEDNVIQELLMCTSKRSSTAKRCRPSGPESNSS
jgi:hypothetical protein